MKTNKNCSRAKVRDNWARTEELMTKPMFCIRELRILIKTITNIENVMVTNLLLRQTANLFKEHFYKKKYQSVWFQKALEKIEPFSELR